VLELIGQVAVAGREEPGGPRLGLAAEKMTWRRDGSTVEAEGGVQLASGPDRLAANRLEARLTDEGESFESAIASGGVTGRLERAGEGRFEFSAADATVVFDPASGAPSSVLLAKGEAGSQAVVVMRAVDRTVRRLAAPSVLVELVDGRPARAAASNGVELRETSSAGAERLANAQRLSASFTQAGELAEAELSGEVRLQDAGWTLDGDIARIAAGGATARITGRPAHARGDRGELRAPLLLLDRAAGRLDAAGGVRAAFRPEESPLAGGDPASADRPVDVEAKEASFHDAPRRFEFRDAVQAAQGESLLFADRLAGEDATSRVTATGKVRTQWTDRPPAGDGAAPVVTVITAERLDYLREAGEAHYSGGVRVRQLQREIAGDDLVVELADGARARRMRLTGAVAIDDRETSRQVTGDAADYDLEAGEVVVTGDPVTIREQSGTTLRGRRALFDQRSGSARLLSEEP
jgi:lipopolysaccharide export system protein LptA